MKREIIFGLAVSGLLFFTEPASAQDTLPQRREKPQFLWGVDFDVWFDNHENDELKYLAPAVSSKTNFSVRAVPTVGIGWGDEDSRQGQHSLHVGGSFRLDISQKSKYNALEPVLFYRYNLTKSDNDFYFNIFAGKFEHRNLKGNYSRAMFSSTSKFYNNVVDGFAFQLGGTRGRWELALDWDGIKSKHSRESFRVFSAGLVRATPWFGVGYSFDTYHMANSLEGSEGVIDHISFNPYVGFYFDALAPWFQVLSLEVGWIEMFDRDRAGADKWRAPGGGTVDFIIQKWDVGIRNRLYWGLPLMPLRGVLGSDDASMVYRGDSFYSAISATRIFNYTYIYWRPQWFSSRGVNFELSVGLHTDGKKLGFQQSIMVNVYLNRGFFKKKR